MSLFEKWATSTGSKLVHNRKSTPFSDRGCLCRQEEQTRRNSSRKKKMNKIYHMTRDNQKQQQRKQQQSKNRMNHRSHEMGIEREIRDKVE